MIKVYKDLSDKEIDLIKRIRDAGEELEAIVTTMAMDEDLDRRWVAIGKTHFQQGLMAITRAVEKPDNF